MLALFPGTRVSVSKLLRALLFGDLMDTDLGATGCKKERPDLHRNKSVFQVLRATANAGHSLPPSWQIHP